jgi:hypothetical protein
MLKFKRVLHAGMRGRDAKGVKIALKHAGHGRGLVQTRLFSARAATDLKGFQKSVKLKADGVYGPTTHAKLTPHFTAYARWLYRGQRVAPAVPGTAAAAAQRLLQLHAAGKFRDDRGTCLAQVQATAKGLPVRNAIGQEIHIHAQVMEFLVWLIDVKGRHEVGVYAICSDHHFDSEAGHAGGRAADVSTIDGVSVTSGSAKPHVVSLLDQLRGAGNLRPWQLISGGYANREDADCKARCIPYASFYGEPTLSEHCNHVHVGY